jgi:protocatechuate 3,4-dioxygenase beta subunit
MPKMNRREMLTTTAAAVATVVVSQTRLRAVDGATPGCVLTGALEEGPFFIDEHLERSDLRSDPVTGVISLGVPLRLRFVVSRVGRQSCTPLTGAFLDVWNCDAQGAYSDVSNAAMGQHRTIGHKFLRGYQVTDQHGVAEFTTVYPGWYAGRAVHVHFKIRLFAGSAKHYEFTSQLFFDDALTDRVHALQPYATKGKRPIVNSADRIYASLAGAERSALTLSAWPQDDGYMGLLDVGVRIS